MKTRKKFRYGKKSNTNNLGSHRDYRSIKMHKIEHFQGVKKLKDMIKIGSANNLGTVKSYEYSRNAQKKTISGVKKLTGI